MVRIADVWDKMVDDADREDPDDGVEGNARLTGGLGAIIFVLLAAEGVTLLSVRSLLSWHAFLGFALIPPVALKLASTGYRFARYYGGAPPYVRRQAPHTVLRLLGPLVVLLTVAVIATGALLVFEGSGSSSTMRDLHQLSFFMWFGAMTVHVLGHIVETVRLAPRDWHRRPATPRRQVRTRQAIVVASIALGIVAGLVGRNQATTWDRQHPRDRRANSISVSR